jgi:hypothetical protein
MRAIEKWLGVVAMVLMTHPGLAKAQGANAFDGTYLGVSATNLGGMQAGSTSRCQTFAKPAPLTIANGHAQAPWASDTLDGQVNPDGGIRMKAQRFAGIFDGRIANQTITGRYQGACNYDLTWQKRPG